MTDERDLAAHVALFVAVNIGYLVEIWPAWLWVTGIWAVGLAAHAAVVLRRRRARDELLVDA